MTTSRLPSLGSCWRMSRNHILRGEQPPRLDGQTARRTDRHNRMDRASASTTSWPTASRYNNEIKMGKLLTVREGQAAVFVNEGQSPAMIAMLWYVHLADAEHADLHHQGGNTASTRRSRPGGLLRLDQAMVDLTEVGDANPIMLRDAEFGPGPCGLLAPMRCRCPTQRPSSGNWWRPIPRSKRFRGHQSAPQRHRLAAGGHHRQGKIPVLDLAGNYQQLANVALQTIAPDLAAMGSN